MINKLISRSGKIIGTLVGITIITVCCMLAGYFTVFRAIDASICIPRTAQKLGIQSDQSHIYQYVKDQLANSIGMNKLGVMNRLGQIGLTRTMGTRVLATGEISEQVEIKLCLHFLNNIVVFNNYDHDGKLVGFYVVDDSP